MLLFFKIRKLGSLDIAEQQHFITEYISKVSKLDDTGIVFKNFVTHEDQDYDYKNYAIAMYSANDKVDFKKLERKIISFSLHRHFVIFTLF